MNPKVVINELVSMTEDAIKVAEDAIKSAATPVPAAAAPSVTLVKVAKDRYDATAKALIKTGSFKGKTKETLSKHLEAAGESGFLELLEKLASTAIFPLNGDHINLGGDLVEKAAQTGTALTPGSKASATSRWRAAIDEAEAEMANA